MFPGPFFFLFFFLTFFFFFFFLGLGKSSNKKFYVKYPFLFLNYISSVSDSLPYSYIFALVLKLNMYIMCMFTVDLTWSVQCQFYCLVNYATLWSLLILLLQRSKHTNVSTEHFHLKRAKPCTHVFCRTRAVQIKTLNFLHVLVLYSQCW